MFPALDRVLKVVVCLVVITDFVVSMALVPISLESENEPAVKPYTRFLMAKRPFCNRFGGCGGAGRFGNSKRWGNDESSSGDNNMAAFLPADDIYPNSVKDMNRLRQLAVFRQ